MNSARKVSRSRRVIYTAIALVVSFVAIELFARIFEPILQQRLGQEGLEQTFEQEKLWQQSLFLSFGGIHRPDALCLWHMQPNLRRGIFTTNSEGFLGTHEFAYPKPDSVTRILLLGDSSPVGLGLNDRESAFGEVAISRLNDEDRQDVGRFELVNGAVSGYTTAQGLAFLLEAGERIDPDAIVCYFGNNDASASGYLSDAEVMQAGGWSRGLRDGMERLATYRLLRALITPFLSNGGSTEDNGRLKLRVNPAEFRNNVSAINKTAAALGATIIWIVPPTSLTWPAGAQFRIFRSYEGGAVDYHMAEITQQDLSQPWWYIRPRMAGSDGDKFTRLVYESLDSPPSNVDSLIGNPAISIDDLLQSSDALAINNAAVTYWLGDSTRQSLTLLERGWEQLYAGDLDEIPDTVGVLPDHVIGKAVLAYNRGMLLRETGDTVASDQWLKTARDWDFHSLRIKSAYTGVLSRLPESTEHGRIRVLDVRDRLEHPAGRPLFIDHCHPTAEGHRILGDTLAATIKTVLE